MRNRTFILNQIIFVVFVSLSLTVNAQNLLLNPDAESGDTQGWIDVDDAWSASNDIAPHSGNYFFWPSRLDIPYTELYQDVDMAVYSASIDAGESYFSLSGWLANWDQYPHDRATLAIEALNGSNEQIMYLSHDHRSPVWTKYQIEGQIPQGTLVLRVHLIATRFVGSDNDGYFDDLSLEISTTAPTTYVTVSAENDETELPVDGTLQLSAETIGGSDAGYTWSSSFDAVATVDTTGLITAHQAGKFTIQAVGKSTAKMGFIELTAYNPEDIVFHTPETGVTWESTSLQEITWEVKGTITSGTLFYSLTGGSDWNEIVAIDSVVKQHYFWTVPDTNETFNNCYIKMTWDEGESMSAGFSIVPNTTAINDTPDAAHPAGFQLFPNFPNPFNPSTVIMYQLSAVSHVRLTVYNAYGQVVGVLVNEQQAPGSYQLKFNAGGLASGVYFYRLQVGANTQTQKMILMR